VPSIPLGTRARTAGGIRGRSGPRAGRSRGCLVPLRPHRRFGESASRRARAAGRGVRGAGEPGGAGSAVQEREEVPAHGRISTTALGPLTLGLMIFLLRETYGIARGPHGSPERLSGLDADALRHCRSVCGRRRARSGTARPRPILVLAPAGRTRPERRAEYLDALSRLRIPLLAKGSELWAVREFDAGFLVALAQLAQPRERAAFRAAIDPSQTRLFDQQLAVAEAAVLDDLVGRRDEEGLMALDVDALSSLHPLAHPLAVYSAVERAHNRRLPHEERTWFSGRSTEARLSARGFPETVRPCTAE